MYIAIGMYIDRGRGHLQFAHTIISHEVTIISSRIKREMLWMNGTGFCG